MHKHTRPRLACKYFPNLACAWDGQHAGPRSRPAADAGTELSIHLRTCCPWQQQLSCKALYYSCHKQSRCILCRPPSTQPLLTLVLPLTVTVSFFTPLALSANRPWSYTLPIYSGHIMVQAMVMHTVKCLPSQHTMRSRLCRCSLSVSVCM